MRSVESSAKTMEEAVTLGLEKLGVSFSDVKIDILDEGSKGFLGFLGGKPVVVRLTVREDEEAVQMPSVTMEAPKTEKKKEAKKPAPKKVEAAVKAEPKAETVAKPAAKAAQTEAATGSAEEKARTFLADVTRLMGVEVTINVHRDDEGNVRVDMFGDTLGILIGRRGETLDALQYLTSLYVNRGQEEYTRVTLDTENYRTKREEALRRLANRMANRCVKTGRKVVMEPMNPYERRILHSALQQNDAVTTHSEGEEPNRHVVITLKQPQ
ncbi:MAG: RNA-binding cell elongation regulator Jag/EloR [Candidatus Limiplasma sp.]|nr:RNA-binding cell elongation regulator Jag/EloR [Candidatus Limiplasma sp.]